MSNSGQPVAVPLQVSANPNCPFDPSKLQQADPQCASGFNLISMAIRFRNNPTTIFQYQVKMPLHIVSIEGSPYHDRATKALNNPQAANAVFQQGWTAVPDANAARDACFLTFQQLGAADLSGVGAAITSKMGAGNFFLINLQQAEASFMANVQLAAFSQPMPVLVRLAWRPSASGPGVDTMTMVKCPPTGTMAVAYAMQSVKYLLSG